jgi:hypothetical protein
MARVRLEDNTGVIYERSASRPGGVALASAQEGGPSHADGGRDMNMKGVPMPKLRVHNFSLSLDGYAAGPNQDLDNPLGVGGHRLHEWAFCNPHLPSNARHGRWR